MKLSPIFGPEDKPVHPGWYLSQIDKKNLEAYLSRPSVLEVIDYRNYIEPSIGGFPFWYFDGNDWKCSPYGSTPYQERYWVGVLKDE